LQQVAVSAAAVHVVPAQSALSLLESLTFGAVHELSVEHLALAVGAGDGTTAGAVLQQVAASAAVVHVVPAQSVLSLLESLTLPESHELRLEHLALVGAALQHVDVSAAAVHVVPAQSALSLLESLTFGAVHELSVEHLALAKAVHLPAL
jgi:hypothetical protein